MSPAVFRVMARLLTGIHGGLYRLSGGRIGAKFFGADALLLTTVGRKSGQKRVTPLTFMPDGENVLLVASNGGMSWQAAWALNLRARPEAEVQIGGRQRRMRAEELTGEERERTLVRWLARYPQYQGYFDRTAREASREIPVFRLRPVVSSG